MLSFIYSTVNAGKSANLIMRAHSCFEREIPYEILVPHIASQRDEVSKVASRIGFTQKARSIQSDECPFQILLDSCSPSVKVLFVDEAQFLTKAQVLGLTRVVDELKIPVFAYGLRTDFKGEPFEGSVYLMAWADTIEEISTFGVDKAQNGIAERATFNMKIDELGKQIIHGTSIDPGFGYVPVSRRVFGLRSLAP